MTNESNVWIKQAIVKQRIEFGNCCSYCGVTFEENNKLEFAHLEEDELSNSSGRGRKERYYHRKRNKKSYTLLCPDHHQEYDDNKITREEVDIWGK